MSSNLLGIRQRVAEEIGVFLSSSATSGSTTTQLEDTAWPVYSSTNSAYQYQDCYLMRPNATDGGDIVRSIAQYTPGSGLLIPDKPWTNAPATNEVYEIHSGIIEPYIALGTVINNALKHCFVMREFTLTPVANQMRHFLGGSASWLTNTTWVRDVGRLNATDSREQNDPYLLRVRGECVQDGAKFYLVHTGQTFDSTALLYVSAMKPAFNDCGTSTSNFGSQNGLGADTDVTPVDTEWVTARCLIDIWRMYDKVLDSTANQRLLRNRAEAAAWFTDQTMAFFHRNPLRFLPVNNFGPARVGPSFGPGWF